MSQEILSRLLPCVVWNTKLKLDLVVMLKWWIGIVAKFYCMWFKIYVVSLYQKYITKLYNKKNPYYKNICTLKIHFVLVLKVHTIFNQE